MDRFKGIQSTQTETAGPESVHISKADQEQRRNHFNVSQTLVSQILSVLIPSFMPWIEE